MNGFMDCLAVIASSLDERAAKTWGSWPAWLQCIVLPWVALVLIYFISAGYFSGTLQMYKSIYGGNFRGIIRVILHSVFFIFCAIINFIFFLILSEIKWKNGIFENFFFKLFFKCFSACALNFALCFMYVFLTVYSYRIKKWVIFRHLFIICIFISSIAFWESYLIGELIKYDSLGGMGSATFFSLLGVIAFYRINEGGDGFFSNIGAMGRAMSSSGGGYWSSSSSIPQSDYTTEYARTSDGGYVQIDRSTGEVISSSTNSGTLGHNIGEYQTYSSDSGHRGIKN